MIFPVSKYLQNPWAGVVDELSIVRKAIFVTN
jgi:hypothetical protein